MTINSIFTVVDGKTKKREQVTIEGSGQDTVRSLRSHYPRFSRVVLLGFEINGKFKKARV